jgi:hypothetical protein
MIFLYHEKNMSELWRWRATRGRAIYGQRANWRSLRNAAAAAAQPCHREQRNETPQEHGQRNQPFAEDAALRITPGEKGLRGGTSKYRISWCKTGLGLAAVASDSARGVKNFLAE